ncbi:MAG: hypothetical protein JXM70_03140 [Pirellulales bacterium]|nr:hypothetical protein [Pirellulales bacterium]
MRFHLSSTILMAITFCCTTSLTAAESIDIDSRLELFVDDYLIDKMSGDAELQLHRPSEGNLVMVYDRPWEGNRSGWQVISRDGDSFRMYYCGSQIKLTKGGYSMPFCVTCYAESKDGIHWTRPELGLVEFNGSKKNNIIWNGEESNTFAPFKDTNPDCPPDQLYKAFALLSKNRKVRGLHVLKSPDGIHWSRMTKKPVITKGYFDSYNQAFWDPLRGEYREYHREFRDGRDIMTSTSKDFINWTEPEFLKYEPQRFTELYTNHTTPYYRAPHILLGFPTRYVAGRAMLTPLNERISRSKKRFGTDYTDGGFMTSRDAKTFKVWPEAFIRPGLVEKGRWVYGANFQNYGLIETKSSIPGTPNELSIYASEGGWEENKKLRRHTLRIDGFVSVNASFAGGEFVTRPITFTGNELALNYSTSAAGGIRVEIQTPDGKPIKGYTLDNCKDIFGDTLEGTVAWKGGSDLSKLAGKPLRLRFLLKDADLYSMRFRPKKSTREYAAGR